MIYWLYLIVSAWVLIPPLQTTTQQFLLSPQALIILTSPSRQTKTPDNFNTLSMPNNNAYTTFKTVYKHFLPWCHAGELFGSQIAVTIGEFEPLIFCIWSNYLTH